MPYTADLRCSYISVKFNISWIYEMFEEQGKTIEFLEGLRDADYSQFKFEEFVENQVNEYIVFKTFGHTKVGFEKYYDGFDNIWGFLEEEVNVYVEHHCDEVVIMDHETIEMNLNEETGDAETTPAPVSRPLQILAESTSGVLE